jgi:hypothetical protein
MARSRRRFLASAAAAWSPAPTAISSIAAGATTEPRPSARRRARRAASSSPSSAHRTARGRRRLRRDPVHRDRRRDPDQQTCRPQHRANPHGPSETASSMLNQHESRRPRTKALATLTRLAANGARLRQFHRSELQK